MDKTTEQIVVQGKRYQDGLKGAFAAPEDAPEFAAGVRQLWEDGMREYLADPIKPIRRRYELFLKRLHKRYPRGVDTAVELIAEIDECLRITAACREKLLEIAEKAGIKLKKGIVM